MKVDILELFEFFDEVLPSTNEELGRYWFRSTRPDGIFIIFAFSIYESYVDIIVHANQKVAVAGYSFINCSEIRVLDMKQKCLEIICAPSHGRCFMSLLDDSVIDYNMRE